MLGYHKFNFLGLYRWVYRKGSRMIIHKFANELDNKITIKIMAKKTEGKNHKTQISSKFTGVCIRISGPASEAENIITRKEAEELRAALNEFLDK